MQPGPRAAFHALRGFLFLGSLGWFLSGSLLVRTEKAADVQSDPKLPVKEVGSGLFEIGLVRFSKTEGTVTIPVEVNMREGAVEYLLVTTTGKTHESVFRTDAEPYHIQLAMLLLNAKGRATNDFPQDKTKPPPGDPVDLELIWQSNNVQRRTRAEEFVFDRAAKAPMQKLKWIYNGSQITPEGFAAQRSGSIISLIDDPDALLNNPLPRRDDDDNWQVCTNRLAEITGSAKVIITLPKNNARKVK